MVSAPGATKTKRVLLGRCGSEKSFSHLADGLRSEGFDVREEKSSPVGAHSTNDSIKKVLSGVDVVLLVVHKYDGTDKLVPPFERVLHDANVIQDSIGDQKVVLLVEESVDSLPDTGLTHIRFPTSRADMILQEVVTKIGGATPTPATRDLHARVPMAEQAMSSALRIPWLLVFIVLISAAIPLAIALNSFRGGDDETVEPEGAGPTVTQPEVVKMDGVAAGLRRSPGLAPQTATTEDQARLGSELQSGTAADSDLTAEPAAPAVTLGGDNALLPAVCEVDFSKNTVLGETLSCRGAGRLVVEGFEGPWHNEIAAVAVADGVVGQLTYEPRTDGSTAAPPVLELASGSAVLSQVDARFGVNSMTLRFGANNQHVHLFRNSDGSGDFATLTFTLDS